MKNPRSRSARFVSPFVRVDVFCGGKSCVLFPGTEDISRALTVLRYSGRPVEGAATRPALRVFNQKVPQQMGTFIVLSSGLKCQTPAHLFVQVFEVLHSGFCCSHYRSFSQRPGRFLENRLTSLSCAALDAINHIYWELHPGRVQAC